MQEEMEAPASRDLAWQRHQGHTGPPGPPWGPLLSTQPTERSAYVLQKDVCEHMLLATVPVTGLHTTRTWVTIPRKNRLWLIQAGEGPVVYSQGERCGLSVQG